jgi:microcystin-dependent protein
MPSLFCSAGSAGLVPAGGIIMWSGTLATIPPGWALCDGNGGRPDLRDRFVMGAGGVQPSTGNGTLTLTAANLPSHTHAITNPINSAQVAIQAPRPGSWVSLGYPNPNAWGGGYQSLTYLSNAAATVTESSGTGAPITIRPPYFALAYIIKLP